MSDVETILLIDEPDIQILSDGSQDPEVQFLSDGTQGPAGPPGASADLTVRIAAFPISGHRVLAQVGPNLEYASADNTGHAGRIIGISTNAAGIGGSVEIVQSGDLTEPSWSFTPNETIYLGLNGGLTQVAPQKPTSVFSQVLGFAQTPTTIFIDIKQPILLG